MERGEGWPILSCLNICYSADGSRAVRRIGRMSGIREDVERDKDVAVYVINRRLQFKVAIELWLVGEMCVRRMKDPQGQLCSICSRLAICVWRTRASRQWFGKSKRCLWWKSIGCVEGEGTRLSCTRLLSLSALSEPTIEPSSPLCQSTSKERRQHRYGDPDLHTVERQSDPHPLPAPIRTHIPSNVIRESLHLTATWSLLTSCRKKTSITFRPGSRNR